MPTTTISGITQPVQNGASNEVPTGQGLQQIDEMLNQALSIDTTAGNVTLTQIQMKNAVLSADGTPTVARVVTTPAQKWVRLCRNTTGQTATFKTSAAGSNRSVVLAAGEIKNLICDGTNVDSVAFTVSSVVAYDLSFYRIGKPDASEIVFKMPVVTPFTLPISLTGSVATLDVATTAAAVFNILSGATPLGTINFAAAATTGTFMFASAVNLTTGFVSIVAPNVQDATLAGLCVALKGVTS